MQGHADIPLDAEGMAQAECLAGRLACADHPPEVIWSSDLVRAIQTARPMAERLGLPIRTTPLLRETMLGDWEGLTREEIEARGDGPLLQAYRHDPFANRPPGGETLEAAWERMLTAAAEIRRDHPSGQVAVVGHGGSLRVLLCEALDAPITSMRRFWLANMSVSIIEEKNHSDGVYTKHLTLLNDIGHLTNLEPPDAGRTSL